MARKNKHPNIVNIPTAVELFAAYGISATELNPYCLRLVKEECEDLLFDWYHTTGSLVMVSSGKQSKIAVRRDIEDVAMMIKRDCDNYGD